MQEVPKYDAPKYTDLIIGEAFENILPPQSAGDISSLLAMRIVMNLIQ